MKQKKLKHIAVFCGSKTGNDPIYRKGALKLAEELLKAEITLVYGGAKVGLMGVLADTILNEGGKVIGVIPQVLVDIEVAHQQLTELHVVESMHSRKKLMSDLADGFMLLPGGAGSLDEFFEIFTWRQLGIHHKPYGILNTNHYFDHLVNFLDHSVKEGFLKDLHRESIFIEESPLQMLKNFVEYLE